jgi:type II secretory pathway component PulK
MKKVLTVVYLILVSVSASIAQGNTVQQKITFRDGKPMELKGSLAGEVVEKSSINDNQHRYKYIYAIDAKNITIYSYNEWAVPASGFDELQEVKFDISSLKVDESDLEITENEPDENNATKYYSLNLSSIYEKEFAVNFYTAWEAKPSRTSTRSSFNIKSLKKESLEKMIAEIKTLIPKKEVTE